MAKSETLKAFEMAKLNFKRKEVEIIYCQETLIVRKCFYCDGIRHGTKKLVELTRDGLRCIRNQLGPSPSHRRSRSLPANYEDTVRKYLVDQRALTKSEQRESREFIELSHQGQNIHSTFTRYRESESPLADSDQRAHLRKRRSSTRFDKLSLESDEQDDLRALPKGYSKVIPPPNEFRQQKERPHRREERHKMLWAVPCSSHDQPAAAAATAASLPHNLPAMTSSRRRASSTKNPAEPHFRGISAVSEKERKIIIEFCSLFEKSKQLFNGLRELPQYGHKQWHSYFGRTFDVYTKLWKFQQQHRTVLDNKYGLKRWQIGEIASKIGQLYYHFYLRTSETAYLNEAYSFYYAIRGRSYYTKASKEDKCELMVKKLRYYARFIVVCLLLKKLNLVSDLIKELDKQIVEYGNVYDPEDQAEWTVVVNEVKAFIKAEPVVSVVHPDNYSVILSHRISPESTPPVDCLPQMVLSLQEVIIVGSKSTQVKVSELTIDMFRMIQFLEHELMCDIQHIYEESPHQQVPTYVAKRDSLAYGNNPHKYLLFKPSPSQILVYLASGCNDLPPNGAILLYISADGLIVPTARHPEEAAAGGYDVGGLITTSTSDITYRETIRDGKPVLPKYKEQQVLHPGDLFSFTRRPMFLVVDSDNSYIFQNMPRHFGQPLVILMSPVEIPTTLQMLTPDKRVQGSLFTLFLYSPLLALCHCSDIRIQALNEWQQAQAFIEAFLAEACQIMTRTRPDSMYVAFMGDDFFRLLIVRFIFCETVMRMHRAFRTCNYLTRSSPPIPDEIFEHPALTHIVMDLAFFLKISGQFSKPAGATGSAPNQE